jgi:oligopeptide/dipeptide ABC transporter ATP-binding protein
MTASPDVGSPGAVPLLTARGVSVNFELGRSLADRAQHRRHVLRAVDGVDLDLYKGEALAIVGESGSGKSTFAKAVTGLTPLSGGELTFEGSALRRNRRRADFRRIQMVFQDPYSSLNPRLTVGQMLRELLKVHEVVPNDQVHDEALSLLRRVGLGEDAVDAYPRQFSGGQRQRVAIARALALRPDVLVADEPVSALDVSVQATILNLLDQLRADMGLTLLFIAHNLAVVHHLCGAVAVMYLGRIVEIGPTDEVFEHPQHPYTRGLLDAIPRLSGQRMGEAAAVEGDPPSPLAMPSGCRFHTRCPVAVPRCSEVDPPMVMGSGSPVGAGEPSERGATHPHAAACLFAFDQAVGPVTNSVGAGRDLS